MKREHDKESVLKGEILWKKLYKVYQQETEETHRQNGPFSKVMDLFPSRRKGMEKPPVVVSAYSDGAGLGNYKSHTGRGLTGYGYGFIAFQSGKVFHPSVLRSEYKISPATVTEAEAIGAIKAVRAAKEAVRRKGGDSIRLTLTTDSLDVIKGLHNITEVRRKINEINESSKERLPTYLQNRLKELTAIRQLSDELWNDPIIDSVKTKWVKGHILDSTPMEDLRHVENYINFKIANSKSPGENQSFKEQRFLFHDMRNNKMTDKAALEGAARSLTKRIDFLSKCEPDDPRAHGQAINTSITLKNSYATRSMAVEYIASQQEGYLDDGIVKCLLGDEGLNEIENKRAKLCRKHKCTPIELPDTINDKCKKSFPGRVIDEYTSQKEVSFIRKFGNVEMS